MKIIAILLPSLFIYSITKMYVYNVCQICQNWNSRKIGDLLIFTVVEKYLEFCTSAVVGSCPLPPDSEPTCTDKAQV